MTYKSLSIDLVPTADAAEQYFGSQRGAGSFKYEEEIIGLQLSLRPTLQARMPDRSILCVEVSPRAYNNSIDTFIVEACTAGWPILLFVAIPKASADAEFAANLRKAKRAGVGVVEFSDGAPTIFQEPVRLSLFGLRTVDPSQFPKMKRQVILEAQSTFREGAPAKGCQKVYEEIEAISRKFAKYSKREGWWRSHQQGDPPVQNKLDTAPWAKVLENLEVFLDRKILKAKCPGITPQLIGATWSLTESRNLTSHAPKNERDTIRRDANLRTWFEAGVDVLRQWCSGTLKLRLK